MANPVAFQPKPLDPRVGLMQRLEKAPAEHAEALLVGYDLLQAAHDQGVLDLLHGMVSAKNSIFEHVAEGAKLQESVDTLRNLISLGKILGAIEPETLSSLVAAAGSSTKAPASEPLSMWGLFKKVSSREGRRGLSMGVELLVALGTRRFADAAKLEPVKKSSVLPR